MGLIDETGQPVSTSGQPLIDFTQAAETLKSKRREIAEATAREYAPIWLARTPLETARTAMEGIGASCRIAIDRAGMHPGRDSRAYWTIAAQALKAVGYPGIDEVLSQLSEPREARR
jgi:hypothetical protein